MTGVTSTPCCQYRPLFFSVYARLLLFFSFLFVFFLFCLSALDTYGYIFIWRLTLFNVSRLRPLMGCQSLLNILRNCEIAGKVCLRRAVERGEGRASNRAHYFRWRIMCNVRFRLRLCWNHMVTRYPEFINVSFL